MNLRAALVFPVAVLLAGVVSAAEPSDVLELKSLRLGMPADEVKAANPGGACESMAEGLERCSYAKASINDREALLELYFMDGTLLSVSYQRLLTRHAQDIGELLALKFGPPTFRTIETAFHLGSESYDRRPKLVWDRGGDQLQVLPFALHDRRADNTFSTVRLIGAVRWDKEWLPRLQAAQQAPKQSSAKLIDADI